jgi:hypothetical protein
MVRLQHRLLAAVALAAIPTLPAVAATAECPTLDGQEKIELLERAPTCAKAMALFAACEYGAGGDVRLGTIVTRTCERDFLAKLSGSQRRAYDLRQNRCTHKYADKSGTMYRSFEAFCSAELAQSYARRFSRGGTR